MGAQSFFSFYKMKSIFFLFIFLVSKSAAAKLLSDLVPVCDAQDPNLNACVVKSANLMIPVMAKGIKSYGFPPLDPLFVPKMNIGHSGGPLSLELTLMNTTHYGLSTMKFRTASIDLKNNRWILNGTLVDYSLEGQYKGNGRILLVRIIGDGRANFTFYNTGVDFVIKGHPKNDKSNIYYQIDSLRVYFKFRQSFVNLTNLFNGNKALGDRTSKFLNENSDEVIRGLKDTLEDVYSALYTNLVKRIISNVPYNQIFKNI